MNTAARPASLAVAACLFSSLAAAAPGGAIHFSRDILPILSEHCFHCHGPDEEDRKAKLRLDTPEGAFGKGKSGEVAIVPGKSAESEVVRRITSHDADEVMPPPKAKKPLAPAQVELLRRWVDAGAAWGKHWAFEMPQRAPIPSGKNPIDQFINASSPEAPKSTLLRRVSIDLIGLPPTRDELRAFLADEAPDAYERVVERLLNDPRHGERWARHWMDVWRYSDWYGRRMVPDVWNSAPQVWRWRDWIVRSLNAGKGYDRMILEMLAADEVAPGDDDARVATGYLVRNWYALNPNDWMRANVEHTAKAFLGLTFNCAHCHDHKYDPLTREDYFSFRAFFEPLYVRQDRVPGDDDPGKFQDYVLSTLRKVVRTGMVSVFDKDADAKTWFYTDGDERNRQLDHAPVLPATPAFLGGELRIEPVKLPLSVSFPGGRKFAREDETRAAEKAIADARERLKAAAAQFVASNDDDSELALRLAQAALDAARAKRDSLKARIAADDVKFLGAPGDLAALAKAAGESERALAVAAAKVAVIEAEQAVRAKKDKADTKLTGAKKTLANAEAAAGKPAADYTPLSPEYPHESTGRRRALAEWITSRANPLTARVAVNHIWLRHFHAPLVASVYNFGRSGALPTHPELLDWLAVEFMESGWDMKHLHRLIVTSAAYRSTTRDAGRMEAEVVRDSVLHLAGELDPRMGGQELENDAMPGSRRRSLYFACHPEGGGSGEFTAIFDAPDPNDCYQRTQSIVPQQALALTNSKLIHDASAPLARCISGEGAEFVTAAFEHLLTRAPRREELDECATFLAKHGRESLVRVLLNHHEFVTIR